MSPRVLLLTIAGLAVMAALIGWDYNRAKDRCLERFSETTCVNILR